MRGGLDMGTNREKEIVLDQIKQATRRILTYCELVVPIRNWKVLRGKILRELNNLKRSIEEE